MFRSVNGSSALRALIYGVVNAMLVVQEEQGRAHVGILKPDRSFVTKVDLRSEETALPWLRASGYAVDAEESGIVGRVVDDKLVVFDPLDGTDSFLCGLPNSTVISGIYDQVSERLTHCVVGEPVSGRIWYAVRGSGTWMFTHSGELAADILTAVQCSVSKVPFGSGLVTYLDITHGFTTKGCPLVLHEKWVGLLREVYSRTKVRVLGSNGAHYAAVANGLGGSGAAITTAKGCPADVAGALLVIEALGVARGFSTRTGRVEEVDPLNVYGVDYLVAGNMPSTIHRLSEMLVRAITP